MGGRHARSEFAAARVPGELAVRSDRRVGLDVSLGLDIGYIVTVPTELHALPGDRPDEELSIATTFAGVGKLDTRGLTYSLSLRGRCYADVRKCMTSPSWTTYSLPSIRSLPAALIAASL